jgi:hypothetical protein
MLSRTLSSSQPKRRFCTSVKNASRKLSFILSLSERENPYGFSLGMKANNSALNHLQNGLQLLQLPVERREVTPVETLMGSKKQEKRKKPPSFREW